MTLVPFSRPFLPTEYDRWLVQTSQEAIERSRVLLAQTQPLIRGTRGQTIVVGKIRVP